MHVVELLAGLEVNPISMSVVGHIGISVLFLYVSNSDVSNNLLILFVIFDVYLFLAFHKIFKKDEPKKQP